MELKRRSIIACLFFIIITGGIYFFVWFYKLSKEVIEELNIHDVDSAPINLLYLIITLGLYFSWWNYKISHYLSQLERKNDIEPDVLAPIFSLFFSLILHQSRVNLIASKIKTESRGK